MKETDIVRECVRHGEQPHMERSDSGTYRCRKCASEAVVKRRQRVKAILVAEAGGKCIKCGYNRYFGALDFHHRDPLIKEFGISSKGMTYSLARMRREAKKCDLICKNCHTELENENIGF